MSKIFETAQEQLSQLAALDLVLLDLPRVMSIDGAVSAPTYAPCHPCDAPPPVSVPDGPDLPDFPAPEAAASPSDDGRASQEGGSNGATPSAGSPDPWQIVREATPKDLERVSRFLEGAGLQPPELPEVKACRRLLQVAQSMVINSMLTIDDLQDKGQLVRYQEDVRGLYGAASLLIYEMHKAHGSKFMPPELPRLVEGV